MVSLCLLLATVTCVVARNYLTDPGRMEIIILRTHSNDQLFEMFKNEYGKTYSSQSEEAYRRKIFGQNVDIISAHNKRYMAGETTFFMGRNAYTDLTLNELLGFNDQYQTITNFATKGMGNPYRPTVNIQLPDSLDWRKNGSVTSVKTQGKCNAGYAFSAVGALEGQYYRATKKLVDFSAQQLIDCPSGQPNFTTFGCAGGIPTNAYLSISTNGGEETEVDYPYAGNAGKNGTCRFNETLAKTGIWGWSELNVPDEGLLQQMVTLEGPVSVRLDANHKSFQNYKGGIYNEPNCSNTTTNHAALIVGYGFEINAGDRTDYWIVKNSFGTTWGEQGYIRMTRNHFNQCGIANNASYPLV